MPELYDPPVTYIFETANIEGTCNVYLNVKQRERKVIVRTIIYIRLLTGVEKSDLYQMKAKIASLACHDMCLKSLID